MEKTTTGAAYAASAGAVFLGLTANDLAIIVGVGIAFLTFLVNWYFKWRTFKVIEKAAKEKKVTLEVNTE